MTYGLLTKLYMIAFLCRGRSKKNHNIQLYMPDKGIIGGRNKDERIVNWRGITLLTSLVDDSVRLFQSRPNISLTEGTRLTTR